MSCFVVVGRHQSHYFCVAENCNMVYMGLLLHSTPSKLLKPKSCQASTISIQGMGMRRIIESVLPAIKQHQCMWLFLVLLCFGVNVIGSLSVLENLTKQYVALLCPVVNLIIFLLIEVFCIK